MEITRWQQQSARTRRTVKSHSYAPYTYALGRYRYSWFILCAFIHYYYYFVFCAQALVVIVAVIVADDDQLLLFRD